MIQKIPLSCTNQENVLIWKGTKNGVFLVKSAYHMQKELATNTMAECSSSGEISKVRKRLWALPIPNIEKNFLWQACNYILPTCENLCKKKIITDFLCPLCGLVIESVFHILW